MHAADDDSVPVPQDAFRIPSGALKWRTPYLFVLIGLGGLYGLLVSVGRLSPALLGRTDSASGESLPLLLQLASAFAGLAALVLVLTRAVREVDKRPYVAIAPVLAVFAALVHTGLRVDLSALGLSSALVALGALAVALLGGALIVRDEERLRWIGWALVLAPCAWLAIVLDMAKGQAPFEPSERAYLLGLFFSTLSMGGAGVAARKLRSEARARTEPLAATVPHQALSARIDVPAHAGRQDLSEAVTIVAPAFRRPASPDTARFAPRLLPHWRARRARTAGMLLVVSVATYLTVGGLRRGGSDAPPEVLPAAMVPAGPPVVQQLRKPLDSAPPTSGQRRDDAPRISDKPRASKSTAVRVETASGSSRRRSPAPAKPARAARAAVAAAKVDLPAWGSEALREFKSAKSGGKSSTSTAKEPMQEVEAAATLAPKPPPYKPTLAARREPPKPAEPPKPMTMDQVLDQVEKSAQAQRKKAGAKQSKVDADLEALINGSMKKKRK